MDSGIVDPHPHAGARAARGRGRVALLAALLLAGCASMDSRPALEASRAELPPAVDGVESDGRTRFRQVFCALASARAAGAADDPLCAERLWRLADEPPGAAPVALPAIDPRLNVFVVGGAFSDCFGAASLAYAGAITALAGEGLPVRAVPVGGRSSAESNAERIAKAIVAARPLPADRIVLIGYSKGSVDILHFLAAHPDVAARVDAVISVAGPVLGSAVAARGAWAYDTLLEHAFSGRCAPGDGGVVDSLLPARRTAWLAQNPLPRNVRYYVLSAFTTREHMARGLLPVWQSLAGADRRNDGQITLAEALIPGSTLLGYANADHWGVAIDIEEELRVIAARPDPVPFPRTLLFEAMLRFVSEDLGKHEVSPDAGTDADSAAGGGR